MTRECERCSGGGVSQAARRLGYHGVCQVCQGSGWVVVDDWDGPVVRAAEDEFDDDIDPAILDWMWD